MYLLRLAFWPRIWSILDKFYGLLRRICVLHLLGRVFCRYLLSPFGVKDIFYLGRFFFSFFPSFFRGIVSEVCYLLVWTTYPKMRIGIEIPHFYCISTYLTFYCIQPICFTKLGVPSFSTYIFTIINLLEELFLSVVSKDFHSSVVWSLLHHILVTVIPAWLQLLFAW